MLSSLIIRPPGVPLNRLPPLADLRAFAAQNLERLGIVAKDSPSQKTMDSSDGLVGEPEGASMTEIWPRIGPVGALLPKGSVALRVPGVIGANLELPICGGPDVRNLFPSMNPVRLNSDRE